MVTVTRTQAVSPGYIYTVTASYEAIVRDTETDKLLCKANKGSQGMFIAIGGTVSMTTADEGAIITQTSAVSGGARFEVQQTRPTTGEEGVIYLIPITSGTDEENKYEEWIWVKGEWESLGTTGVNLSNYATLTDANTYSGNNTFNGLLLKGNSASLGDTSVLNRSEMDARYGKLSGGNTWRGVQQMENTLMMHSTASIVTSSIQSNDSYLHFNALHLVGIGSIDAYQVNVQTLHTSNIIAMYDSILVAAPEGIQVTEAPGDIPTVTISPSKIEAFQLNANSFGFGKYGLRITPDSCQLFGIDFASSASGAIVIGAEVNTLQAQSVTIGRGANTTDQQSVTIGFSAEGNGTSVAIGAYAHADDHGTAIGSGSNADGFLSIAIGNSAAADKDATALGCYTIAQPAGIAIGSYCNAEPGLLNLSVGGNPFGARFSMLLYGGDSYDVRDATGYLKFEIGDTVFNDRSNPGAQTDSVTISKPNLWSALDNAKYRGAQPYAYYDESAISNIPVLEPNSITHIYTSTDAVIDLSGLTLAQHDTSITTAELWIDVTTAGATITWPEDMLWPDELDPTAAPILTGAETSNKLYAIVVRKQATRAGEFLVASVAYSFEYQIT